MSNMQNRFLSQLKSIHLRWPILKLTISCICFSPSFKIPSIKSFSPRLKQTRSQPSSFQNFKLNNFLKPSVAFHQSKTSLPIYASTRPKFNHSPSLNKNVDLRIIAVRTWRFRRICLISRRLPVFLVRLYLFIGWNSRSNHFYLLQKIKKNRALDDHKSRLLSQNNSWNLISEHFDSFAFCHHFLFVC